MKLIIYQVDAFADKPFEGNPAAIVPLEQWLSDATMQAIAEENNLSETAFFVPQNDGFHIRWFTPHREVELCGHATLASAFVLYEILNYPQGAIVFDSLSGSLTVTKSERLLTLDFPSQAPVRCEIPEELIKGLGKTPLECHESVDILAVFENEADVLGLSPNNSFLEKLDHRGVIATAPSVEYDFVSRFFAPKYGIPEDPVTGSAHTQLIPYWSEKLGKAKLNAKQVSRRGGKLTCQLKGDRVLISGCAVRYMEGVIEVEP